MWHREAQAVLTARQKGSEIDLFKIVSERRVSNQISISDQFIATKKTFLMTSLTLEVYFVMQYDHLTVDTAHHEGKRGCSRRHDIQSTDAKRNGGSTSNESKWNNNHINIVLQ